jgi:glycosyltransferase involved in cell wall biosynthesis
MRIGIDASNLKSGGGLTHLTALLEHVDARAAGVDRVIVWGPPATLERLTPRPWLSKTSCVAAGGSAASTLAWRRRTLPGLARAQCDLLLAPGGLCTNRFHPVVTMSRNMLPFQWREAARYGPSRMLGRLAFLRALQQRSFHVADGVIFLSRFAERTVLSATGPLQGETAMIPHGVAEPFFKAPRPQRLLSDCSRSRPFRMLYTSIVDVYKHQWHIAEAVARLRHEGLPLTIEFAGDAYPSATRRLERTIRRLDPHHEFLKITGPIAHSNLPATYHSADAFVFASSCENLPNTLLEAMAAGLPIACSRSGPMPEVLKNCGLYFDPLQPIEIAECLRRLVVDPPLRYQLAARAQVRARDFSWPRCAQATFAFLADVLQAYRLRQSTHLRLPVARARSAASPVARTARSLVDHPS